MSSVRFFVLKRKQKNLVFSFQVFCELEKREKIESTESTESTERREKRERERERERRRERVMKRRHEVSDADVEPAPPSRGKPSSSSDASRDAAVPENENENENEGWRTYESVFTNRKAGMNDVDRDKIKKIVYEASKDSAHFKNEKRKEEQVQKRLALLRAKAKDIIPQQLEGLQAKARARIAELEATRDLSRTWLHVDMDAFYAACHILENPSLKDIPMAVGGMGMISTANYEARKYGVRSAMPGFLAVKLCPHLKFVKSNFQLYKQKAKEVRDVLALYDPNFISGGLDESYLDVTEYMRDKGLSAEDVASNLRGHVCEATKLTCSVGVAANRMLAKICSDLNKPNGQYLLEKNHKRICEFISDLPVRKIPGIGKQTELLLNGLGIQKCRSLLDNAGLLSALFSNVAFEFFLESGLGIGSSDEPAEYERKGISCERTFASLEGKALEEKLQDIVTTLGRQMAEKNLKAKHMTVKMKRVDFVVKVRYAFSSSFYTHTHTRTHALSLILTLSLL